MNWERDEEFKENLYKEFTSNKFPIYLEAMANRLKKNEGSKYLVGDKLTIADITLSNFIFSNLYNDISKFGPGLRPMFEAYKVLVEYKLNMQAEF